MASSKLKKHIAPLHVNGMDGRILRAPAPGTKKRQILLLYGHHSSLERMFGLAEILNKHGAVTMPDLPGLGGMDAFYKLGQEPTLDNYADYLASLIKLYYKRKRLTIFAMSFSVPLVIRMLQKYPDLAKKTDMFISIAGFAHHEDFMFTKTQQRGLRSLAYVFSRRWPAAFLKTVVLTKPAIKGTYLALSNWHAKIKDAEDKAERDKRIAFEVELWKINDARTWMSTLGLMLTVDLCKGSQLKVSAYHVTTDGDQYFNHDVVEQHLHVIFKNLKTIKSEMSNHAPTIVATADQAAPYVPKKIHKLLG